MAGLPFLPAKDQLLRFGARLPPSWKGPFSERAFGLIVRARNSDRPLHLKTNLGLDKPMWVELPVSAPSVYLFGTPQQYIGERGALLVACELAAGAGGFIDIGANHGYFSFAVAARYGNQLPIHYFEPNPELFAIIDRNVRRLGLGWIKGHRAGVGPRDETATFYLDLADDSQSSLNMSCPDKRRYKKIEIDMISFSSFCKSAGLSNLLVKVDVEGAEFKFLDGVSDCAEHISHLVVEVLGPAMGEDFIAIAEERLGMTAYYIDDYRLLCSPGDRFKYSPPQYNWLFSRETQEQLSLRLSGTKLTVIDGWS
jgi:FkbM family methyltransferase